MVRNQEFAKGITLIEVLIASFLFAVAALGSATMFVVARRQVQVELHRRQAIYLAVRTLEELKARPYDDIRIGTDPNTIDIDGRFFTKQVTASLDDSDWFKNVIVTIGWDQDGQNHSVSLDSSIAPGE